MSASSFRGQRRLLAFVALAVAVGVGAAVVRSGVGDEPRKEVNPTALRHAEQLSEAFHNAQDIAMPSVVTIRSKAKARAVTGGNGNLPRGQNPFKGTPFEDFFNGEGMENMIPNMPRREGMGSGVIIDPSGIVLTNNHVVAGADEVTVHLADGREFKADDIKTDDSTDLAVIRIHGAGSLPAAVLGDSDKLRIGDWVMAIGSPFELDQTVSAGIISGKGRELSSIRRAKFLQTDAAINPGNSGGPLINLHGEVVGINTAIATNSGSFNGIGFAIPSNLAKWVTGQLIKKGSVQRAYLGVGIGDLTSDLAEKLNAENAEGVVVTQVHPDTPAANAGFEDLDVITKFSGQKVKNARDLQELVERVELDSKQDVEILRDGKKMTLSVTPRALPKEETFVANRGGALRRSADPAKWEADEMGIEVSEVSGDQATQLGLKNGGVLITRVDPEKAGHEAGLRAGMVILKVGRTPVGNLDAFKAAMKDQTLKDKILLSVQVRPGQTAPVVVK